MSHIKLVIVGDGDVGKTTLLIRKCGGVFTEEYSPTVFDTYGQNISHEGKEYFLNYYDTAGQEDYKNIRAFSYPNTDVFVLAFAINDRKSFENVRDWFKEIRHHCPQTPIVLAGLKLDLRKNRQSTENHWLKVDPFISNVEGEKLAKDLGCYGYHECSAKKNHGVNTLFEKIALEAAIDPDKPILRRMLNLMSAPIRKRSFKTKSATVPMTEKLISCSDGNIIRVSDKILKEIEEELPSLMVSTKDHSTFSVTYLLRNRIHQRLQHLFALGISSAVLQISCQNFFN